MVIKILLQTGTRSRNLGVYQRNTKFKLLFSEIRPEQFSVLILISSHLIRERQHVFVSKCNSVLSGRTMVVQN